MADSRSKNFIDDILGDDKKSAIKQIALGASSGWFTGFIANHMSKPLGVAVGGGIILLELAYETGYIKINWDKVNQKLDKVSDKIEERVTGQGPSWVDKAERFVDRKANQAEKAVRSGQKKAKRWYTNVVGEPGHRLTETHIFFIAFIGGLAIGISTFK